MATIGKRPTNTHPGYVYIVTNKAWPGKVKIGFTQNLKNRIRQMNTNDPHRAYRYYSYRKFNDKITAEAELHKLVVGFRIPGTEWFRLDQEDAFGLLWSFHSGDDLASGTEGDGREPNEQLRDQECLRR